MPREKEQKAYTFSQTLRSQIRGLNIVGVRSLGYLLFGALERATPNILGGSLFGSPLVNAVAEGL